MHGSRLVFAKLFSLLSSDHRQLTEIKAWWKRNILLLLVLFDFVALLFEKGGIRALGLEQFMNARVHR